MSDDRTRELAAVLRWYGDPHPGPRGAEKSIPHDPDRTPEKVMLAAADLIEEQDRKLTAIDALHALHQCEPMGNDECLECAQPWPCATRRLLDGEIPGAAEYQDGHAVERVLAKELYEHRNDEGEWDDEPADIQVSSDILPEVDTTWRLKSNPSLTAHVQRVDSHHIHKVVLRNDDPGAMLREWGSSLKEFYDMWEPIDEE